jgi:hypothetical protein
MQRHLPLGTAASTPEAMIKGRPRRLPLIFQSYSAPLFFVTICTLYRRRIPSLEAAHQALVMLPLRTAASTPLMTNRTRCDNPTSERNQSLAPASTWVSRHCYGGDGWCGCGLSGSTCCWLGTWGSSSKGCCHCCCSCNSCSCWLITWAGSGFGVDFGTGFGVDAGAGVAFGFR